jgi:hypothetical protein
MLTPNYTGAQVGNGTQFAIYAAFDERTVEFPDN